MRLSAIPSFIDLSIFFPFCSFLILLRFIACVTSPDCLDGNLPTFSYKDLRQATQYFSRSNLLAQGEYGKVYKGMLANGCFIAVKEMNDKNIFDIERHILSHLQHPNIVRLFGYCIEGKRFLLVYEFMEKASLDLILLNEDQRSKLNWQMRLRICKGVAKALHYLHEESGHKIIYRDVKASNVLLDKDFNPKLSDFCLSRPVDKENSGFLHTEILGTAGYIAPEYVRYGQLSTKADIYSFGVLLMELATGRPTNEMSKSYTVEKVEESRKNGNCHKLVDPVLARHYSYEALQLIDLSITCTKVCPEDRPKMSAVLDFLEGRRRLTNLLPQKECVNSKIKAKTSVSEPNFIVDKEARTSSPTEEVVEEEEDKEKEEEEEGEGESTPTLIDVNNLGEALAEIMKLQITPTCDLPTDLYETPESSEFFDDLKSLARNTDFNESLLPEKQAQMLHLWESLRTTTTSPPSEILDQIKDFLDQNPELISAVKIKNEQSLYISKYDSVKDTVELTKTEAKKFQDRSTLLRSSIESTKENITKLHEEIKALTQRKEKEEAELEEIGGIVASDLREAPRLSRWLVAEFHQQKEARRMVRRASERIEKGQLDWKAIQKNFTSDHL